jgi:hypothetical protein
MVDRSGKVLADDGHVSEDLTEGQARATLLMACGNVSTLQEDTHGRWHGYCSKGAVMVDARGNVVVDRRDDTALTRGEARAIASNACGNVSSLSTDGKNEWMGTCSKGSFAIDPAGKLAFR